jgi:hypothetical protein
MLSLTAESLCLLDGKHNIAPPIIPEEQEFVHFNTLWCYLFYRLSGEEKEDKGIAAFTIIPSKNLTISALLDRQFPPIAETNHKPLPFITTKTVAYIFALVIDSVTIFHQDSPHSRALQHEASILEVLNALPPDEFRTELRDSLTDFYEKILLRAGAGGRPVAKPMIRKFVTKAALLSDAAPADGANDVEAPPPPIPAAAAAAVPAAEPATDDNAPPPPPPPEKPAPPTPPPGKRPAGKGGKGGKNV